MKRKRIIAFVVGIFVIIIVMAALYSQTLLTASESSVPEEIPSDLIIPEELPSEEIPPSLHVIPEVPLGTLGIMLAFFFALAISQVKHKVKL